MTNLTVAIATPVTAIVGNTTMNGTLVATGLITSGTTVLSTHIHAIASGSSAGSTAIPT
jgi:phage baseplate assembly protein gpV